MRILLAAALCLSAHAKIHVRSPGCYQVQGTLRKSDGKTVHLEIQPGSASEELLAIGVPENPRKLIVGGLFEVTLHVKKSGRLDKIPLEAQVGSFRPLSSEKVNPAAQMTWVGEPKDGKCP